MRQRVNNGISSSLQTSMSASHSASEKSSTSLTASTAPVSNVDTYAVSQDKPTQGQTTPTQQSSSTFDPYQLLNPRGANTSKPVKTPLEEKSNGTAPNFNQTSMQTDEEPDVQPLARKRESSEPQGVSSHIERLHGVQQREDQPMKKQRREGSQEANDKKANFTGRGAGGDLGRYVQEKKKEGLDESGVQTNVVDLTGFTLSVALTGRLLTQSS